MSMTRLAALVLLWVACCGWTLPISWRYPTTNVDGTPLTDLDHAEITLRQCNGDSLRLPNIAASGMEGDSVAADLTILDTVPVVIVEARAVDTSGNRSGLTSLVVAHEASDVPPPEPGVLMGEYWRGSRDNSFNQMIGARAESTINYSWGTGSPWASVPADSFCVRWTGKLSVPTTGAYVLWVRSADGFRLWVDGTKVKDWWMFTFAQSVDTPITLTAGQHDIRLDYFANLGDASCVMSWEGPGFARRVIEAAAWR